MQGTVDLLKEFEEINAKFAEPMDDDEMNKLIERQGEVQEKLDHADAWDLDSRLEMAMDALRCPPPDTLGQKSLRRRKTPRRSLPSAAAKAGHSACSTSRPTTSTPRRVGWLEQHLQKYEGTIIAVTHDRYFLDNIAGWILELDRGEGIPYKGNYSSWLEQKSMRLAQEERNEDKLQKTLERELEWIRMSPKGRHAKSKARINDYEAMVATESEKHAEDLEIYIPPGPRLGDVVIEAHGVSKAYGDTVLFEKLEFSLPKGGIVGVIGPNGAGKTTLFRLITGQDTAGRRHVQGRRNRQARLRRPVPRQPQCRQDRLRRDRRRAR